jgi:rod shape-determining protein MreC
MLLGILSIVLMVLDHRFKAMEGIHSALTEIVQPLRNIANLPANISDWASDTFVSRTTLQEEIEKLRLKNQLLNAQLQKYTDLKAENDELRAVRQSVETQQEQPRQTLFADILSVDLDPYRRKIVINKGSQDGVYVGQPLIGAQGVVGKVVRVNRYSSIAMLLTDANHALSVKVFRGDQQVILNAIAIGNPRDNQLELIHQPNNANIMIGDRLITSGLGCDFPGGYQVGVVTDINTDPSLPFAEIIAKPTAQLTKNRVVMLIWPAHRQTGEENICDINLEEDR